MQVLEIERGCILNMYEGMSSVETVGCKRREIKKQNYIGGRYTQTHTDKETIMNNLTQKLVGKLGKGGHLNKTLQVLAFKIYVFQFYKC